MAYSDVITAKADAALKGRIEASFTKRALQRATVVDKAEDQREQRINGPVLSGAAPDAWTTAVIVWLDNLGTLANPTDAQIDTAVAQVITRIQVV